MIDAIESVFIYQHCTVTHDFKHYEDLVEHGQRRTNPIFASFLRTEWRRRWEWPDGSDGADHHPLAAAHHFPRLYEAQVVQSIVEKRELLSDILNKTADEINDVDEGIIKIKGAFCCRRTLIVLDDVDKWYQFNAIVGMQHWLFQGSKIIVTTRNKASIVADGELFSWNAFGCPVEDFLEDSWRIVCHCNGLPLLLIPNFQVQKIELQGNRFNVVLEYDENEMLEFYEEEGLIQKEFEEHLSFKISSPVSFPYLHVYLEIRNNTKGRVWVFYPSIFRTGFTCLAYHTPSNEYWSNLMEYENPSGALWPRD
ncbi:hypothetical protein NC651_026189 [Populus alba x Populus x berolinensis]|nr:hypothetical protein NC651_026189 [Populus alba x Populus x berolinensis]